MPVGCLHTSAQVQRNSNQHGCCWQGRRERLRRTLHAHYQKERVDLSEIAISPDALNQIGYFIQKRVHHQTHHSSLGYLTPASFESGLVASQNSARRAGSLRYTNFVSSSMVPPRQLAYVLSSVLFRGSFTLLKCSSIAPNRCFAMATSC